MDEVVRENHITSSIITSHSLIPNISYGELLKNHPFDISLKVPTDYLSTTVTNMYDIFKYRLNLRRRIVLELHLILRKL